MKKIVFAVLLAGFLFGWSGIIEQTQHTLTSSPINITRNADGWVAFISTTTMGLNLNGVTSSFAVVPQGITDTQMYFASTDQIYATGNAVINCIVYNEKW